MITPFHIYMITVLSRLGGMALAVTIILGIALLFAWPMSIGMKQCIGPNTTDEEKDAFNVVFRVTKNTTVVFVVAALLTVLCPSKKESAAIIVIPKIANSETVSELGDGMKTLAAEWLEELRPSKQKKEGAQQ